MTKRPRPGASGPEHGRPRAWRATLAIIQKPWCYIGFTGQIALRRLAEPISLHKRQSRAFWLPAPIDEIALRHHAEAHFAAQASVESVFAPDTDWRNRTSASCRSPFRCTGVCRERFGCFLVFNVSTSVCALVSQNHPNTTGFISEHAVSCSPLVMFLHV